MKKIIAFLTAFTMICCSSCSNSSSENKSENMGDTTVNPTQSAEKSDVSVTEKTTESDKSTDSKATQRTEKSTATTAKEENPTAATEKPKSIEELSEVKTYREYKNDDFYNIKVKAKKQETMPPVECKIYENIEINLPAKIPSCSAPENFTIEKLEPDYAKFAEEIGIPAEEYKAEIIAQNKIFENLSVCPDIEKITSDGENIYYLANYDKRCINHRGYSHCFTIYRYNLETGENATILEYDNGEQSYQVNNVQMKYHKGKLWFISNENFASEYTISRLDLESKTVDYEKTIEGYYYNFGFCDDNSEILTIILVGGDGETTDFEFYGFDEAKQELIEFADSRENIHEGYQQFYKGSVVKSYKEDKKIVSECDHFRLETGLRVGELIGVTDKSASYLVTDSISTIIYTYNFEKMERYTLDISSFGQGFSACLSGDNIILNRNDSVLYIIPELGAVFQVLDPNMDMYNNSSWTYVNFEQIGDKMLIYNQKNDYYSSSDEGAYAVDFYTQTNKTIEKVIVMRNS